MSKSTARRRSALPQGHQCLNIMGAISTGNSSYIIGATVRASAITGMEGRDGHNDKGVRHGRAR